MKKVFLVVVLFLCLFNFANVSAKDVSPKASVKQNIYKIICEIEQKCSPNHPSYIITDIDDEDSTYTRPGPYGTTFHFKERTYEYRQTVLGMHTVIAYGYYEEMLYDINAYGYPISPELSDEKYIIVSTWGVKRYISTSMIGVSQAYSFNIVEQDLGFGW